MLPILYSFRRCPYAMRARVALHLMRQPFALREVDLKHKPPAMLKISPKGTVPVLLYPDGRVLDESVDIVRALMPAPVLSTEPLLQLLSDIYIPALNRFKYPNRYDQVDRAIEVKRLCSAMQTIAKWYGSGVLNENPDSYSQHDVFLLPFLRQLYRADAQWFEQTAPGALFSYVKTYMQSDLHEAVMVKQPVWEEGRDDT